MASDPHPGSGPDGQELGGSTPPADGGAPEPGVPWLEDDWDGEAALDSLVAAVDAGEYDPPPEAEGEGLGQGLYVCLPPGQLTLPGFAQDGTADTMPPGALLATVIDTVTGEHGEGLAALSDDQLIGVISAARRLESRTAWTQLAALREFATRRDKESRAEFAADELVAEFPVPCHAAADQLAYACAVAGRLPRTFAALAAGRLHPVHVRIIEDETRVLSPQDAAAADEALAEMAGGRTFSQLRYAARRLVLKLDPDAALRRKEDARREAHVRRFREDSGNAGMVARELPPDEVLASWQHVEQRALDLRAAGVPGTLQELRVRAYLDLLQERDSRDAPGNPGGPEQGDEGPGGNGRSGPDPQSGPPEGGAGTGRQRPGDAGPSVAALVTITVPLETLTGQSQAPGEAAGFGLLDPDDARDLAAAAARHPATRWCVTALAPDGTAAAHACAPGRHQPPPDRATPTGTTATSGDPRAGPDPPPPPNTPPPGQPARDFLRGLRIGLSPVARGQCDHAHAELSYHPSRKLQHLIRARSTRCTAPGCTRPAARCDLDHTTAWDKGGRSCECNLAPLCRHHHRCKQAEGWRLEQPEPGVLRWRTPSGRTYTTAPTAYPI